MARVEYKGTAGGVVVDRAGNARAGVTITHTGTAPFAASTGGTAYGGALTTNIDGEVPGWLDPGIYTTLDPTTGKSVTFEVGGAATTTNEPSTTEKAALAGSSGAPSGSNKYVTDADPRNTDARLPLLTVGAVQPGILAAADFKVTQRAAGANQSVDVAGSTLNGGGALVRETATGRLKYVTQTGTVNLPVGVAHATLPRIDKVYVTTAGALGYVEGTATSGATLDNMTGEPAVPANALFCGALLRPAATNNVTTGNMRDRRPWATGAFYSVTQTSGAAYTTAVGMALVDTTNLQPRIECSGVPLTLAISGNISHNTSGAVPAVSFWRDGAAMFGTSAGELDNYANVPAANYSEALNLSFPVTPAAGTHLWGVALGSVGGGTATMARSTTNPLIFWVREDVRPNANNT
jgi:hypothetical protein